MCLQIVSFFTDIVFAVKIEFAVRIDTICFNDLH